MKKLENVADIYPLTPTQSGILYHALRSPDSEVYFEQLRYNLHGRLDIDRFREAFDRVIERHPIFRTMFVWDGVKEPLQIVRKKVDPPIEWLDLRGESDIDQRLDQLAADYRAAGMVLTKAPVLTVLLIQVSDELTHLIWNSHHILLDGWSSALAYTELMTIYEGLTSGEMPPLKQARPFKDYVAWLKKRDLQQAETFWSTYLADHTDPAHLLPDPVPPQSGDSPGKRSVVVPKETVDALKEMIQRERLTLNTVIQGAWGVVLSRMTGKPDVVFGGTVSGRPAELPHVESIIGMFISTMPVRVQVDPTRPLVDWLKAIQGDQLEMRRFEFSALADIHRWSDLPSGQALFNSIVVFENYPIEAEDPHRTVRSELHSTYDQSNYALDLMILPEEEIRIMGIYDQGMFHAATIDQLLGDFTSVLEQIASNPTRSVGELAITRAASPIVDMPAKIDQAPALFDQIPAEVTADPGRLVRYLALEKTGEVTLPADTVRQLSDRFVNLEKRLPDLQRIHIIADRFRTDLPILAARFRRICLSVKQVRDERPIVHGNDLRHPTIGFVAPSWEVSVVDEKGEVCPAGWVGDLHLHGESIGIRGRQLLDGRYEILEDRPREATAEPSQTDASTDSVDPEQAEKLLTIWKTVLGVDSIELTDNFFDLGGHSTMAVQLFSKIKQAFSIDLPLATLFRSPTPLSILQIVNGEKTFEDDTWIDPDRSDAHQRFAAEPWVHLVEINAGDEGRVPFFCVHGAGGNVLNFRELSNQIGADWPFYGIQANGVDGVQPTHESLDEMVEAYLAELRAIQPEGPYLIGGYSGGGVVAYEMAQTLTRMGETVLTLVLFDTFHPSIKSKRLALSYHLRRLSQGPTKYVADRLERRRNERETQESKVAIYNQAIDTHDTIPFEVREWQITGNLYNVLQSYEPVVYPGHVTLITAEQTFEVYSHVDEKRGWDELIPNLEIHFTPGNHDTLVLSPNVERLGPTIRQRFEGLTERSGTGI